MTSGDGENLGLPGAHTAAENSGAAAVEVDQARAAKVGAVKATVEAAIGDLVGQMAGGDEGEQASLMLDEIDEQQALFKGPVRHVANTIDAARRGRGRPKGSQNKASAEFRDVFMRMGHRHAGLNLGAVANADPAALAIELGVLPEPPEGIDAYAWLRCLVEKGVLSRGDASALMDKAYSHLVRANAELMPYFESKAPTKVNVDKRLMGVMLIGDMASPDRSERKALDLTQFDAPSE